MTENKRWQVIVAAKAENAGTVTRLQKAARAAAALLPSKAAVEAVALFAMLALLVHDVWAFGWGTSNGRYMSICDTLNSCLSFRPFLSPRRLPCGLTLKPMEYPEPAALSLSPRYAQTRTTGGRTYGAVRCKVAQRLVAHSPSIGGCS